MTIPSTASGAAYWSVGTTASDIVNASVGKKATTIAVTNTGATNALLVWVRGLHKEQANGDPVDDEFARLEPGEKEYFRVGQDGVWDVKAKAAAATTDGKHAFVADERPYN